MSAGHHVPSFGVPIRETIMDTPTDPAGRSSRRDETADANDTRRDARFTIHNLQVPAAGTSTRHWSATRGAANVHNLHLPVRFV